MFGFGGLVPVDKEAVKVVSAMQYLRLREDEEVEKVGKSYKVVPTPAESQEKIKRIEEVRSKFRQKEIAVLRRAAGSFAKLIDA
jgi:uncharacterized membrane protein